MENKKDQQLDIELSQEIASGVYSNLQLIQHSPTEFVLDFIQIMPGLPKAQVKSRIIMSPVHAKKLLDALKDNISKYEMQNGEIIDTVPNIDYNQINPMGKA
ncbi:MAG: DUF3467 domain-containing protein [Bacteroidales bacterium]|jgi:hypothetical protein|nr:DUF3467 domain-containing protein [Bacteroidales bacterium]